MSNTVKYAIVGSAALVIIVALMIRLRYHARGAGRVRSQLRDPNPAIRISALHSIGELGVMEFIDELRPLQQTEYEPAVLDALMIEILTSKTSHITSRKLVELRSWAVERQNRVHGGRLPENKSASLQAPPVADPKLPVFLPAQRQKLSPQGETSLDNAGVADPGLAVTEIADVDLWAPDADLPELVFLVPEPVADEPSDEELDQVIEVAHGDDAPVEVEQGSVSEDVVVDHALNEDESNEDESNEDEANEDEANEDESNEDALQGESEVDAQVLDEAKSAVTVALEAAQLEAVAIEAAARREAEAVARAAEHEAESLANSARDEAERLAREAELVARQLTEAAAAEAVARIEEAAQQVMQMKHEAEVAATQIREGAQREVESQAALLEGTPEDMVQEAEAEADALIEAARVSSMDLVERSRRDADVIIAEAAAERQELLHLAEAQVATVEAHAAAERRALLDATYAQCLTLIEQLPLSANLSASEAKALLETWRLGAGERNPPATVSDFDQFRKELSIASEPEHLVVIVKSPREIAKAKAKAEAKAKKKEQKKAKKRAKKQAKRERQRAEARVEKERLAASVEHQDEVHLAPHLSVAESEVVLAIEPARSLSILQPEDEATH